MGNNASCFKFLKLNKIKLIIVFTLLLAQDGYTQEIQTDDSIEVVKNLIRKSNSIESFYIGGHPKPSKQCLRFLFLLKRSNLKDIITMSNDSNLCLRTYAYASLLYMRYKNIKEIKLSLQTDTLQLFYIHGCVGGTIKIAYILENIKHWYKEKEIEHWVEEYDKNESLWIKLMFQT